MTPGEIQRLKLLISPGVFDAWIALGFAQVDLDDLFMLHKSIFLLAAEMMDGFNTPEALILEFKVLDYSGKSAASLADWAKARALDFRARALLESQSAGGGYPIFTALDCE